MKNGHCYCLKALVVSNARGCTDFLRKTLEDGCQTAVFTGCPLISASTEPEVWDEISNGRPLIKAGYEKLDMNFNQLFPEVIQDIQGQGFLYDSAVSNVRDIC